MALDLDLEWKNSHTGELPGSWRQLIALDLDLE